MSTTTNDTRPLYQLTVEEDNARISKIVNDIFAKYNIISQVPPATTPRTKILFFMILIIYVAKLL